MRRGSNELRCAPFGALVRFDASKTHILPRVKDSIGKQARSRRFRRITKTREIA
jgi:hypothetical protein